jgi:hypothetical protein
MIRVGLTEIALFLTPFVLYAVFLYATRTGVLEVTAWPASRVAWLAMVAFALVIGSFIYFAHFSGAPIGTDYVPAHLDEQGNFVPGRLK